ncbi:MAG TPA: TonB-dependent receptor [Candidatus Acidoferrum sp.]|nr:TonB-dependent receptor [Candidatus Acidoferrum sp.]
MTTRIRLFIFSLISFLCLPLALTTPTQAQQTLGGITGAVTDPSGAAVPDTTVTAVGDQTSLTRTQKTDASGVYTFVNLPIGTYTLTFAHESFQTQKIPSITVQANRTVTVNASLSVGAVSTTVTVEETPLVNAVDTTNGYVLDKVQIEDVPLPTGSFTGLAILSPGVNAELPSGNGVNAGLGNAPIWANGQRDTSNTFLLNGVDAKNLFNGKSTSSVGSARVVNNTGVSGAASTAAFEIQSSASPYLAIGQALPTPAPETIQEVRVNTSMYDAQQGSTSGAHIDMSTASGTNDIHGQAYLHHATDWLNAAPFFFKQDPNVVKKVPELHREVPGGTLGGPLIKNKLFGFISYQNTHDSDQQIGLGKVVVPVDFTPAADPNCVANRTSPAFQQCVVDVVNNEFPFGTNIPITTANIDPIALKLLQAKLPNGQYMIPYADSYDTPSFNFPETAIVPSAAYFLANQAVANLDVIATPKDTLALKYYYQHDPSTAPFAYSSVAGFTQHLDAGSQVATITNTQTLTPTFNVAEVFGFIREKLYSTVAQPPGFTPTGLGINAFQSVTNDTTFPGITIADDLGTDSPGALEALQFGETAASQGAFTGIFQNRFMPSANAIWINGRHTITFGGTWSYTQLNARDDRTNKGMIGFADFSQFVQGLVTPYTTDGFIGTIFLQGNARRHYRANETGEYIQDKFQLRPNLSVTAGLRWDYNGGLTEKNGLLYNFDPSRYSYNPVTDSFNLDASGNPETGFIIAGNNSKFPTKGVSNSTLTGRQWGFAPRIGLAWSPKMFNNKLVVRTGWGMYYDRGELFSYLSPGFATGIISAGPFGVNQTAPYVLPQSCTNISPVLYLTFVPTCVGPVNAGNPNGGDFEDPWGLTLGPPPTGNPATLLQYFPHAPAGVGSCTGAPGTCVAQGIELGQPLFAFAVYNRANKLPYTMNQTLDIQWQPRNDLAIDIGYVGNLGRHEVIPVPFNQAGIASPSYPLCGGGIVKGAQPICNIAANPVAPQSFTYGYTVVGDTLPAVNGQPAQSFQANYENGNVDLRVPYIGYSSQSESYTAAGVSAYNAVQAHVEKRMSHGVQLGFSYTYSHSLDEQSALGLFYNGNNPLNLRSAYGNSDFDRTHVFNFSYLFQLHNFASESSWQGKIIDGWALSGTAILQSGQPFSVIDYSGAVGSIFYGTSDGITNPIVPLVAGRTPKSCYTGHVGAYGQPALQASCFTLPLLSPDDLNGAIPPGDLYETNFIPSGERNIFRQSWQKRADISIIKNTKITERVSAKYSFDVFNFTNTPSFDIPVDDVTQNEFFDDFPSVGTTPLPTSCTPSNTGFYNCPFGLGNVNKIIGSPRQIQMSLSVLF